jgi:histidinol-phosphate aminotransferase
MSWLEAFVRPQIRALRGYQAADYEPGCTRLNANEAPWLAPGDRSRRGLNVYPPPRPLELARALAEHYGVEPSQVLVTRGSSEAIDLLIRSFCSEGERILICPPTFGMYEVYAAVQGAEVVRVPLRREDGFALDESGVNAEILRGVKLLFLCSPNNPTGNCLPREAIERFCTHMAERGLVVVDEAYVDFLEGQTLLDLLERFRHLVLLRTLSKAYALAGIRCGTMIAHPDVVELSARVMPPYGIPTPSLEAALHSLAESHLELMRARVHTLLAERERMAQALGDVAGIRRVFPSDANFLLLEVEDAAAMRAAARHAGILIRAFDTDPALVDCLRVSIGTREQNDALLASLGG